MALTNMQFTKDWREPADFPTIENSEIQVRADIQILYDELAANINTNIAKLQATASGASGASNIGVSGITGFAGTTIQSVIEAIGTAVTTTAAETYSKTEADAKYQTKTASDELLKSITFDPDDGSFTITTQGGLVTTIDTDIEKIPVSVSIIQSGSTYKLRITNEDGTYSECDVSALFNAVNFTNSETIAFTQTINADGSKTVSGTIRPGSVTSSMLDDDFLGDITDLVHDAQTAATNAAASESNAASSETNAAQSALEAANSESDAANYAIEARSYARGGTGSRAGENTDNAKYYKEQTFAKADIAEQYRLDAEAYARGTRDGDAVGPSDPTYHNNSKYYSEQSAASALSSAQSSSSAAQSAADALADKNAAAGSATAAAGSATAAAGSATAAAGSASAASTSETNAANSASAAAASAASVGTQASDAEAAARGTRNGVPVGPDDEFYHDNAEYYKDQAAAIVGPQQPKITATGILKGEGDGVVSAAVAGTDYQAPLPSQSGQSGKFLTTNGSALSWDSVDALPSQSGQSGKFLTTNGTAASWATVEPEVFWVNLTITTSGGVDTYSADKTFTEILAAHTAGKLCLLKTSKSGEDKIYRLHYYTIDAMGEPVVFDFVRTGKAIVGQGYSAYLQNYSVHANNTWEFTNVPLQNRITASGILKGDGAGGVTAAVAGTDYVASPEVFIATYGTTTLNELTTAVSAGKVVVVKNGANYYTLGYYTNNYFSFFQLFHNGTNNDDIVWNEVYIDSRDIWFFRNNNIAKLVHTHEASDITSGTLGVARGGTGASSFTANSIVMSGSSTTAALTTRAVTNNTSSTAMPANTNIPTNNTVKYGLDNRLNRTTAVNAADTAYTTYMARGEALNSSNTNPTVNGCISWTYE